jgi:hypothetical protein
MKAKEFVIEDAEQLKSIVTGLVKQTDDEALLHRVYTTLKSNDLTSRITAALNKDQDVGSMLKTIAQVIITTEGTVDEKMAFAENYPNGFVDVEQLFSKNKVNYNVFVAQGFPQRVFDNLVPIIKQGVGPGELAFSIMSPKIRFTGQEAGGGDLEVDGVGFVELKTEQVKGARWINPRKANMNMMAIKKAIETASGGMPMPGGGRINVSDWPVVRSYIQQKNPKALKPLCQLMADSTFTHVTNSMYANALLKGTAEEIKQAIAWTGFSNYKAYSGFDGILMLSVPKRTAQYFTFISEMEGRLKISTAYVLAPEGEMMPQILLTL